MRLSGTLSRAISTSRGLGNQLWDLAGERPSLDLPFSENKSLVDATTGAQLVTFTRASSGTFVGSDGVLQRATTNLLLRSEDFGTTWVVEQGTVTTNQATAPNGTVTADDFEDTGSGSGVYQLATITANTIYTASMYLKRGDTDWYRLYWVNTGFTGGIRVWVNLATGALGTVNTIGTASNQSGSITSVGDGWYRVSVTGIIDSSSTTGRFQINSASADNSGTRVINANAFLWGAQLEQSTTVGEYIPTTSTINSAPRFDHNPTTGESLGLLVEESRTNLLLRSEEFDDASWTASGVTVTANSGVAPDGNSTADKIIPTASASTFKELQQNRSFTSGTTYTVSLYVKAAGYEFIQILGTGPTAGTFAINYSLVTGTETQFSAGTSTVVGRSITPATNGWYRITASVTAIGTGSGRLFVNIIPAADSNRGVSWTGDGTSGILFWGAQLEAGAFPTSYIPTTTAAATRSADVASISGSNFSSWYRQDEGSLFVSASVPEPSSGNRRVAFATDGTGNNRVGILFNSSNNPQFLLSAAGTITASISSSLTASGFIRSAAGYAVNNFAFAVSGALAGTDTSGAVPSTVDRLSIGSSDGGDRINGHIRRLTYWPTRLSNATLQTITQ